MSRRSIWVVVLLGALLAVPAFAGASSSSTAHRVKLTGRRDAIWSNSSVPGVGLPHSSYIVVGTASGTIGGRATGQGAWWEKSTFLSFAKAKGHGVILLPGGSIRFKASVDDSHPKFYTEAATVTGGTGTYKNASGTLSIKGRSAHVKGDTDISTNNVTGTLNF